MNRLLPLIIMVLILGFWSCKKDNPKPKDDDEPGPSLQITAFSFEHLSPAVHGTIDQEALTIALAIPRTANIKQLTPSITFTEGASITPLPGFAYDFTDPLTFRLSKEDKSVSYTVGVTYAASAENNLSMVRFPDLFRTATISGTQVSLQVPFGTNLEEVMVELAISAHATVTPASGSKVDLRQPLSIVVKAEDGQEKTYTLTVTVLAQETGVRAFWIPDPSHGPNTLRSIEGIRNVVNLAKDLNFNTLFVAAWAKTRTLYPSQVLAQHSSYNDAREGMFTPNYTGISGDPLKDLIDEAHAHGLKVILWYEYGFMARWGDAPTPANDRLLAVNPHWIGINSQGQPSNYNGTDYYYNAYHPEVQQFMLDLIMEAVQNYNIDGIQGDDRMPAMPRNSGYDTYTVERYKSEHDGQAPPASASNWAWVRWRADILNKFAKDMFQTVKAAKPHLIVASSPNPYPWAFDNLMQEWPVWLKEGSVELLNVQCYRYTITNYQSTIDAVKYYYVSNTDGNLQKLAPGIILSGSAGLTDPNLIAQKMLYNRSIGITGESFFFDAPLFNQNIQKVIRAMYPGAAIFPQF